MFVVDTNLLIHVVNEDFPGRRRLLDSFGGWRASGEPWFATWSIVYEFLRVSTHPSVFRHPLSFAGAWEFIETLLESRSFSLLLETDRHAGIVRELTHEYPRIAGNPMHDLHIAALMREHGVTEIRTADTDFHQFKFLRVVNPL
ncbi:MAG: TA system VapC family ribonuclease toxin [Terriglobia bacterium]